MLGFEEHVKAKSNNSPLKQNSEKARCAVLKQHSGCRENRLVGKGRFILIRLIKRLL